MDLEHPVCGRPAHGASDGGLWAYPSETRTTFASVKAVKLGDTAAAAEAPLPHPTDFDAHTVRKVTWQAKDGTTVVGLVCERDGMLKGEGG